jgi:hypothetical protein
MGFKLIAECRPTIQLREAVLVVKTGLIRHHNHLGTGDHKLLPESFAIIDRCLLVLIGE